MAKVKERVGDYETVLMPEGDYAELTVCEWGQSEYDSGYKSGRANGIAFVREHLMDLAAAKFTDGFDEQAKQLRDLAKSLPSG